MQEWYMHKPRRQNAYKIAIKKYLVQKWRGIQGAALSFQFFCNQVKIFSKYAMRVTIAAWHFPLFSHFRNPIYFFLLIFCIFFAPFTALFWHSWCARHLVERLQIAPLCSFFVANITECTICAVLQVNNPA